MQSQNSILNALPAEAFAVLQSDIRHVDLPFDKAPCETGQPVHAIHFPHSGVVSLVTRMEDGAIEAAMVGRDGIANGTSALDDNVSLWSGCADGFMISRNLIRSKSRRTTWPT